MIKLLVTLLLISKASLALDIGKHKNVSNENYEFAITKALNSSLNKAKKKSINFENTQTVIGLTIDTKAGLWNWNKGISTSVEFHFLPPENK